MFTNTASVMFCLSKSRRPSSTTARPASVSLVRLPLRSNSSTRYSRRSNGCLRAIAYDCRGRLLPDMSGNSRPTAAACINAASTAAFRCGTDFHSVTPLGWLHIWGRDRMSMTEIGYCMTYFVVGARNGMQPTKPLVPPEYLRKRTHQFDDSSLLAVIHEPPFVWHYELMDVCIPTVIDAERSINECLLCTPSDLRPLLFAQFL